MDALPLLAGAGLLAAGLLTGLLVGYLLGRRDRRREPQPVCGCRHHRSMHTDGGTGRCMVKVDTMSEYNAQGVYIGYRPVGCACQQYVGPEPLTSLWTPPLLSQEPGR